MRRTCTEDERRRGFIRRGVVVVDAISAEAGDKVMAVRAWGRGRGFLMWMLPGAMTLAGFCHAA